MKTIVPKILGVALLSGVLLVPQTGHAFLKKLFGKENDQTPSAAERQSREASATDLLRAGQAAESKGSAGKAISTYKKLVKRYPLTDSASIAQFRIGELREQEGSINKAFIAYQTFIERYKQNNNFQNALQRQFDIASAAKDGAKGVKWLGIGRKLDSSRIVEMYETVIANAPRSLLAPKAQMAIGETYAKHKQYAQSVAAYQLVVDEYPESEQAAEAALKVGKISFDEIERGTEDAGSVVTAREAMEDYLLINPDESGTLEAEEILDQLDETTASQSYGIARFYQKQGKLRAAAIYYNDVLKFPSSEHFSDARDRLSDIASSDPEAVAAPGDGGGEIARNDLVVPAATDVKGRSDYLGPPAPAIRRHRRKPKMRAGPSIPVIPIEEPDLPVDEMDITDPIDGRDLLLPPPPPSPEMKERDALDEEDTTVPESPAPEEVVEETVEESTPEPEITPPPPPAPEPEPEKPGVPGDEKNSSGE